MRLFIAEKPNMGKTIASFLPGPHIKHREYIETGGGIVTWCVGHILKQSDPEAYGEKWAQFPGKFEDLPVAPGAGQWKMEAVEDKKGQIAAIRKLLKQCTEVVHAGDPGREGQLIVDEVLDFCNNNKPVSRILLNALDKASVMKALANLEPNNKFYNLYQAALGRQHADWMVGMNMSRAYTILGQRQNYRGVLSIGRVQTPTLAIVVRRDEEIEAFVPKDFFSVHALFKSNANPPAGGEFWTTWLPPGNTLSSESDEKDEENEEDEEVSTTPPAAWQDEQRRVIDKNVADKVAADVKAAGFGVVTKAERKPVDELAPVLFELSTLQTELNGTTGAGVKDILAACQNLYEKGHVSYPRTDCAYMPESQHPEAGNILSTIASVLPNLAQFMPQADALRKSRVFDDKKMVGQEHHGIVPTASAPDLSSLPPLEKTLYEAVARRYMAQFLPNCEVDKSLIEVESAGHKFAARGRIIRIPGWRVLFGGKAVEDKKAAPTLPQVDNGQKLDLIQAKVDSHRTTPPAKYTQGTLLRAMKYVHLLVTDPVERKKLKAVEGIGRAATRAAIVETLLKRGFLTTEKNKLSSSSVARILIKNAPRALIDPGLTARWENALDAVASGQVALSLFEQKQLQWLQTILTSVQTITLPPPPPEATYTPGGGSGKSFSGSKSSSKPAAKKPSGPPPAGSKPCPSCKKGHMLSREIKSGAHAGKSFLGCSNYPACKHSEWPK